MRTFILRSVVFFVFALVTSILVFFWLHNPTVLPALSDQAQTFIESALPNEEGSTDTGPVSGTEVFSVPEGGVKLSTLNLGENQIKALEAAGIDVETFVITQPMISCGVGKLGDSRAAEIFAGDTPSLIETTKLLPCLNG
jgi:hypothetical protein